MVHIQLADESDVDVVVARWKWEAQVIGRAERMTVMGVEVPVPMAAMSCPRVSML